LSGRSGNPGSILHVAVVAKITSMYSAMWTTACAGMIYVLQLVAWARTGTWTPIATSDALRTAGVLQRAHYSMASAVETEDRWPYDLFIDWLSEFPLMAMVLIVAALLFFSSVWIGSYEKNLRNA
jgi:hypothetical protein